VQKGEKQVEKAVDAGKGSVRQLLGMKGADAETNIWKIRLQLTKPVTWVPLIWGKLYVACCMWLCQILGFFNAL
jgi:hypothetical protein